MRLINNGMYHNCLQCEVKRECIFIYSIIISMIISVLTYIQTQIIRLNTHTYIYTHRHAPKF